jgi:hypothetical protein
MWKEAPEDLKKEYTDQEAAAREEYKRRMAEWRVEDEKIKKLKKDPLILYQEGEKDRKKRALGGGCSDEDDEEESDDDVVKVEDRKGWDSDDTSAEEGYGEGQSEQLSMAATKSYLSDLAQVHGTGARNCTPSNRFVSSQIASSSQMLDRGSLASAIYADQLWNPSLQTPSSAALQNLSKCLNVHSGFCHFIWNT